MITASVLAVGVGVGVGVRVGTFRFRFRFRFRLGGGVVGSVVVVGSVLVATPGSVHSTFIELQLLIIPQPQTSYPYPSLV